MAIPDRKILMPPGRPSRSVQEIRKAVDKVAHLFSEQPRKRKQKTAAGNEPVMHERPRIASPGKSTD
jgi:hypothetical protein